MPEKVRKSLMRRISRSPVLRQKILTCSGFSIVFIASISAVVLLPISETFKGLISIPSVGALIGALWQIFRDQAAFDKQLELQRKQQFYNLAVTSHMANVAFDKHVEFCEKYMKEVHDTVSTLFREGPTPEALKHAASFYTLRSDYAAWITEDIASGLLPFEQVLRRLGSKVHLVDVLNKEYNQGNILTDKVETQRRQAIEEMHSLFGDILNIENKVEVNQDIAVESIKTKIRKILGIEELTKIRELVIQEAASNNKLV